MDNSDFKSNSRTLKRADPSTIQNKFLVGYQGWFTCGGDGEPVDPGHHGWLHWFNCPLPDGGRPTMDLLPDVSTYSPSELFPAPGLTTSAGEQVFLFSSRHPKTVQRHFHWMAEHGIDGAFLQRFVSQCDPDAGSRGILRIRDEVGGLVRDAAEKEGRVFAIMYDVSGVDSDKIQRIIERDWVYLIRQKGILDSPNYLKEKGKPVIALWGFGFNERGHTPALVRAVTNYIRTVTPGGVYIIAGSPAHWRTAESDADRNPEFRDVWLTEFDAISPWTVGRFKDEQGADLFCETKMKGDIELIKLWNDQGRRKIDYLPVVFPGFSGYNLSEGKWGLNEIKRKGGRFLWTQIFNATRLGVRSIYGAMWDEYDEGTVLIPAITHRRKVPASVMYPFLALEEDGYDLPPDWFMRICGLAGEGLRNERQTYETFPVKELQDYWSFRPKYEELPPQSHTSRNVINSEGNGQSYEEWVASDKETIKDAPPPYSLEVDERTTAKAIAGLDPSPVMRQESFGTSTNYSSTAANIIHRPTPAITQPGDQYASLDGPPLINHNSRPRPQTATDQTVVVSPGSPVSVSSLASNFDSINFQEQPQHPPRPNTTVPPYLRPPHGLNRPHTFQASYPARPSSISRPLIQPCAPTPPISTYPTAPCTGRPVAQEPQLPPNPNPWGPSQQSSTTVQSSYPQGAKLARPHTYTAAPSTSPRPSGSVSPQPHHGIPSGNLTPNPALSRPSEPFGADSGPFPGPAPYPASNASHYAPNIHPAAPYGFPSSLTSHTYSSIGSSSPTLQTCTSSHQVGPHSPHSGYPAAGGTHNTSAGFPNISGPNYSPSPYGGHPLPSSYGKPNCDSSLQVNGPSWSGDVQFPQAQTTQGLHSSPEFPGHFNSQSSNAPFLGPYSTGWYPGGLGNSHPPPMPPRPATAAPYGYPGSQGPSFPVGATQPSVTSGPVGFALGAVDKLAGKKRREQLESGMGNLVQGE